MAEKNPRYVLIKFAEARILPFLHGVKWDGLIVHPSTEGIITKMAVE